MNENQHRNGRLEKSTPQGLQLGQIAPWRVEGAAISIGQALDEAGQSADTLLLWLSYGQARNRVGTVWVELWLGERCWVRFDFKCCAFCQALFAAAEVRRARDQAPPPPDASWFPSMPPGLRPQATSSAVSVPPAPGCPPLR